MMPGWPGQDRGDVEFVGDLAGEQGAGAAAGHQGEVARVVAAAHRVQLDGLAHAEFWICRAPSAASSTLMSELVGHGGHGRRGPGRCSSSCRCRPGRASARSRPAPPGRRWRSVRFRRGRSRRGRERAPAECGPTRKMPPSSTKAIEPPPAPMVSMSTIGHHGLVVADLGVQQVAHPQLAAGGDADVGGGAADIQGDDIVEAGLLAGPDAADQSAHGAGHQQGDRALAACVDAIMPPEDCISSTSACSP